VLCKLPQKCYNLKVEKKIVILNCKKMKRIKFIEEASLSRELIDVLGMKVDVIYSFTTNTRDYRKFKIELVA
jgi:hypothetical protein